MKIIQFCTSLLVVILLPINMMASVEVLGSLKHILQAKPGDVIRGEIQIQNNDSTDQEVKVYQTDLLYNLQDQTFYDEPGAHKRSNYQWIEFSPRSVILRGQETRMIQYEITVPQNEQLTGTFWSVIMVEGVIPIDPNQKGDLSIRTVTRYAIQMVTEMPDKGDGQLTFKEPTLLNEDNNTLFLAVDLENTGDHYILPDVSMELFDENGETVAKITAPRKGLYPTTSTRFMLDLEGIPSKKTYKAIIIAAGQEEDIFGLEYTLYF